MKVRFAGLTLAFAMGVFMAEAPAARSADADRQLDRLEAEIRYAEDVSTIKRLQRAYGYYLDKGMWTDLAEFFTEDAVANYPAGVYVGKESIREHLYRNVGGGEMGQVGLGDGRLYDHMNIQPVVHVDPGGETAKGRWRALALFGNHGGAAIWAEGVYELTYAKVDGVWKIRTLNYHAGFGAPYETGWKAPEPAPEGEERSRRPRNLPHKADRSRDEACGGFPEACIAPFHYDNPGTSDDGHIWTVSDADIAAVSQDADPALRAADLRRRALRLDAETAVQNLQRIYGYYYDRRMWDQLADLFAEDGTMEMAQRGVYKGRERIRAFLDILGPEGLSNGQMHDRLQMQTLVTVAPDGKTARARSRELSMIGELHGDALWEAGIYENSYVREDGVWKIQSVHYYPTFITDYDLGWAKDARPAPGVSDSLPPDAGPTEIYEIYPSSHIPPYHYRNPVTGNAPTYPDGVDRSSDELMPVAEISAGKAADVEQAVAEAQSAVQHYKDYNEIENLESAYGFYLDKNLWNDLADLFSEAGSMELAQRGVYKGRDRIRQFLLTVFGRGSEGPVEGRLGNHIQLQPVISIAKDGQSANIRVRMLQQMSFGPRASLGGAVYENEAVKEDGRWKLSRLHAYNTFSADYEGGWAEATGGYIPGPSEDFPPDGPPSVRFEMFPTVYHIPFHYTNPVSGRSFVPVVAPGEGTRVTKAWDVPGMPPEIAEALAEIGPRIEGQKTTALYAPLLPEEPYENAHVARDLTYGPHERHVLDVFTAPDSEAGDDRPVVVFVHGGGFSRGDKRLPDTPFYDNVALWAVDRDMVGVTVNYRLAPEFQYPSGVEDLTRVVAWLKENIADYGGDPEKVFLWGHSAGAAHTGDYIAANEEAETDAGIAGAILTSGFYDFGDEVSIWKDYYGDDVSQYPDMASLPELVKTDVPLFVNDGELDPPNFREDTHKLVRAREAAGKPVPYVHLKGHSHLSETYAVGSGDETLTAPVLQFIQDVSRNQ